MVLAKGKTVQIVHVPLAITGLSLFSLWIVGLVVTMKATGILPREAAIPLLSGLELGAGISAWGWLLLSARYSFRFSFRRQNHANGY
jgi:Na+/phosphate symporter